MRVLHLSCFSQGGAETAALRLHECLLRYGQDLSVASTFRCLDGGSHLAHSLGAITGPVAGSTRLTRSLQARRCYWRYRYFQPRNHEAHSIAYPDSGIPKEIHRDPPDVVHLHNIRNLMISIEEISLLPWPVVWFAHDHWPFAAAEHHPTDDRWIRGYSSSPADKNFDLNAWTWHRKHRAWLQPRLLTCASTWMMHQCHSSALADRFLPLVVPYPLNLDIFRPTPSHAALTELGFDPMDLVILFGATGGLENPRKGGELLMQALHRLAESIEAPLLDRLVLAVFGQNPPECPPALPIRVRWMGSIDDHRTLARLYGASRVCVVPSLQEPFGQVATEALACGAPVVAFSVGGFLDNIQPGINGFLADPFDPASLASGLRVLCAMDESAHQAMRVSATASVARRLAGDTIAAQLRNVYAQAIESFRAP